MYGNVRQEIGVYPVVCTPNVVLVFFTYVDRPRVFHLCHPDLRKSYGLGIADGGSIVALGVMCSPKASLCRIFCLGQITTLGYHSKNRVKRQRHAPK